METSTAATASNAATGGDAANQGNNKPLLPDTLIQQENTETTEAEDGPTILGSCIRRVVHRDNTLTHIIITPTCFTAYNEYDIEADDDVDSIEAEENSVNHSIYKLNSEVIGSREWFSVLGVMIGKLPNLTQLTFDGLDTDKKELERFWGEISVSTSLTTLKYINMNLEHHWEERANAPNLRSIMCLRCTISKDILGYLQGGPCRLTTLRFDKCCIHIDINAMAGIVEFNASVDMQCQLKHNKRKIIVARDFPVLKMTLFVQNKHVYDAIFLL